MGEMTFVGGKFAYKMGTEGPAADWWHYEDKAIPQTRLVRGRRLRPRRGDDHADHLRGHAPGLLGPEGPPRGHGRQLDRGPDVLPVHAPLLRPDLPRDASDKELALALRPGLQRLDGRRVVRRHRRSPHPAHHHPAVGRASSRPPRSVATPRAACAPPASREIPPYLGLPSIHSGYWDPFFAACDETQHRRQHAHRLVVEDAVDLARRTAGGRLHAHLRQRMSSMVDFMMSGVLVRFPNLTLAYAEGQIGWIPYILERADKVWEENRGWNGVVRHDPRAAEHVLLPTRSTAASSTTSTGSPPDSLEKIGVDNITVRDRLPALATARGRTPRRSARS